LLHEGKEKTGSLEANGTEEQQESIPSRPGESLLAFLERDPLSRLIFKEGKGNSEGECGTELVSLTTGSCAVSKGKREHFELREGKA